MPANRLALPVMRGAGGVAMPGPEVWRGNGKKPGDRREKLEQDQKQNPRKGVEDQGEERNRHIRFGPRYGQEAAQYIVSVHKAGYFADRPCIFSSKDCENAFFKKVCP
jgi:hypothetical protein